MKQFANLIDEWFKLNSNEMLYNIKSLLLCEMEQ